MDLIYVDYNCFQRSFDDVRQIRIRLEASACEEIFKMAEIKTINIVWSFMHEDENMICPFIERKLEVSRLSILCKKKVRPNREIYDFAKGFQEKAKLSSKDAIHLACAHYARCKFLLTCDDEFVKHAKRLKLAIKIMNPIDYIREVDK